MEDTESPVYKALHQFFWVYLTERNIEKTLALVTDDICYVGTGLNEVAFNKKELEQLLITEMVAMPRPVIFTISNYFENIVSTDAWNCFFDMDVVVQISETETIRYSTRFTGNMKKVAGQFLLSAKHMSEPSANQGENEFFPISFVATEKMMMGKEFQHTLIDTLMKTLPGGIMGLYAEEGLPIYVINEPMLKLLDYSYDELMAETNGLMEKNLHPDDVDESFRVIDACAAQGDEYEFEYRLKKSDGNYLWVHEMGKRIVTENGKIVILCFVVDISEKMRIQEYLIEETMRDPLTRLYNRKACDQLIVEKLIKNDGFAFLMLDIDNFKQVNDIYGHHIGDVALIYLSDQLVTHFCNTDIIVRLGGDEFIIYIHSPCDVDLLMQKMKFINHNYMLKIQGIAPDSKSTLSIAGTYGKGSYEFLTVYQKTDEILYKIKRRKKGNIEIRNIDDLQIKS